MLADGFREGDYVFERIVVEPGTIIHKGEKDKMDGVFNGIWRWRPLSKEKIEGFVEEAIMQTNIIDDPPQEKAKSYAPKMNLGEMARKVFGGGGRVEATEAPNPQSPMEDIALKAFREAEDEKTTYRAIRVLLIEGTKGFVRETLKRSVIDAETPTAFIEQGGTVSYRSTKFEKVLEIEEAELGE